MSEAGEAYIGEAQALLDIAISEMQAKQLPRFEKTFAVEEGAVLIICHCGELVSRAIVLFDTATGIITHPRSGGLKDLPYSVYVVSEYGSAVEPRTALGVAGGWEGGETELATEYIFPLVDNDNASFLIGVDSNSFVGGFGSYGNLYWSNEATDPGKLVILSWRGTPTRHFRLPNNVSLPGISNQETASPGAVEDTPIFTTFGTQLYQNGVTRLDAPRYNWPYLGGDRCLILGAAQTSEGKALIIAQSDHYKAPSIIQVMSDGERFDNDTDGASRHLRTNPGVTIVFEKTPTSPGIFITLWEEGGPIDGWTLLAEVQASRTGVPWFANSEGTEFICGNGDRLSVAGPAPYSGEQTETGGNPEFHYKAIGQDFYEYSGLALQYVTAEMEFTSNSQRIAGVPVLKDYPMPYDMYTKTPATPLTGVEVQTYGGFVRPIGGTPPFVFSGDMVTPQGALKPGACGSINVSVTDACGTTASQKVKTPFGRYIFSSSYDNNNSPADCPSSNHVDIYTIDGTTYNTFCSGFNCNCPEVVNFSSSILTAKAGTSYTQKRLCTVCTEPSIPQGTWTWSRTTIYNWVCP